MNIYLTFISFFLCFFVNYSESACMNDFSPGSSPRRPKLAERVKSPDGLGFQSMDVEASFSRMSLKPRVLLEDLENSDIESSELADIRDDSPKAMPIQFEEGPGIQIPVIVKHGLKRAGDKLESYPKRFFSETGGVIQKLHAKKPFLCKARSISTSPKRSTRSKQSLFGTP